MPVALILPPDADATGAADPGEENRTIRLDAAHPRGPRLVSFTLGRNRLAVPERSGDDRQRIAERLAESAETLDLLEPFTRIREAIEEAQQAAR